MSDAPIPFIDLRPQHAAIREELFRRWEEDLGRADFILGASVREFEQAFAALTAAPHALAVNSGTDALLLALRAFGIGHGDEVIMPVFTFIATADVVIRVGATPVLVDVDAETYTIDLAQTAAAITERTRAIMPVHLYGRMAPMDKLMELARKKGLIVIEDACQATGSSLGGRQAGTIGDAGGFSFYPTKNIGAAGDGGLVTTTNAEAADAIRKMRDHGRGKDGLMELLGYNSRMSTIQASYLLTKLKTLPGQLEERRRTAIFYNERFAETAEIIVPEAVEGHTFNYYTIRLAEPFLRDGLRDHLKTAGIGCSIYYDPPMHLHPVLEPYGHAAGSFPVSESAAKRVLSLPVFPGMTDAQRERVAAAVVSYVRSAVVHSA